MTNTDRRPLRDTPVSGQIARLYDNRLGAVYSALHAFWMARNANTESGGYRRDAYSVILFDRTPTVALANDFQSSPSELIDHMLEWSTGYGTKFSRALSCASETMESYWSSER